MNILENYNTAKQKYGEKLVKSLSDMGIPSQYLLSACRFATEGINPNDIKLYFRQWVTYVKRNDRSQYDVNKMTFDNFYQTIQTFKSRYGVPDKIYDDGTVSIGKITSPKDISKFPVKNNWCIKQPKQFSKYVRQGYAFYLIDNGDESDYIRYVVLMVGKDGRKYYYDLDNSEMNQNSISEFQSHLTPNAINFIQNLNNNLQQTNENRKMSKKQTIRLNEAQLKRIVAKAVKRVLNENDNWCGFHSPNEPNNWPLEMDLRNNISETINEISDKVIKKSFDKANDNIQKTLKTTLPYETVSLRQYDKEFNRKWKQRDNFQNEIDRRISHNFTPYGVIGLFIDEEYDNSYEEEGISYDPLIAEFGKNVDDLYNEVSNWDGNGYTPSLVGIFAFTSAGESLAYSGSPSHGITYPQTSPKSRIKLWQFLEELEKNGNNRLAIRIQ